jgi:hypothetical protein
VIDQKNFALSEHIYVRNFAKKQKNFMHNDRYYKQLDNAANGKYIHIITSAYCIYSNMFRLPMNPAIGKYNISIARELSMLVERGGGLSPFLSLHTLASLATLLPA